MTYSPHPPALKETLSRTEKRESAHSELGTSSSVAYPGVLPDAASLREAALAHVARFATTQKNLQYVLQRRIRRWFLRAQHNSLAPAEQDIEACCAEYKPVIEQIIAEMVAIGAVDDARFARSRVKSLTRSGRSRRAVAANLLTKGVTLDTADEALDESLGEFSAPSGQEAELAAALVLARKRNLGPFARYSSVDEEREVFAEEEREEEERGPLMKKQKEAMRIMGIFARNGFSRDIAQKALAMDRHKAEEYILAFRAR